MLRVISEKQRTIAEEQRARAETETKRAIIALKASEMQKLRAEQQTAINIRSARQFGKELGDALRTRDLAVEMRVYALKELQELRKKLAEAEAAPKP